MPMRNASSRFTHVADAMTTRPVLMSTAMTDHVARAVAGRQRMAATIAAANRRMRRLASLVERWGVDPKIAEIDVALGAMVDLIVDDVMQQRVNRHLPLAERSIDFLESSGRNLTP